MIQNVQSGVWDFNGALLCPRILAVWQSKQLLTQLAITVFMRGYTIALTNQILRSSYTGMRKKIKRVKYLVAKTIWNNCSKFASRDVANQTKKRRSQSEIERISTFKF